jgi:hypothetical protein
MSFAKSDQQQPSTSKKMARPQGQVNSHTKSAKCDKQNLAAAEAKIETDPQARPMQRASHYISFNKCIKKWEIIVGEEPQGSYYDSYEDALAALRSSTENDEVRVNDSAAEKMAVDEPHPEENSLDVRVDIKEVAPDYKALKNDEKAKDESTWDDAWDNVDIETEPPRRQSVISKIASRLGRVTKSVEPAGCDDEVLNITSVKNGDAPELHLCQQAPQFKKDVSASTHVHRSGRKLPTHAQEAGEDEVMARNSDALKESGESSNNSRSESTDTAPYLTVLGVALSSSPAADARVVPPSSPAADELHFDVSDESSASKKRKLSSTSQSLDWPKTDHTFPQFLMELLTKDDVKPVLHWEEDGKSVCMEDRKRFVDEVMIKYFPGSSYKDFLALLRSKFMHKCPSCVHLNLNTHYDLIRSHLQHGDSRAKVKARTDMSRLFERKCFYVTIRSAAVACVVEAVTNKQMTQSLLQT